jgi:hypothetical protein
VWGGCGEGVGRVWGGCGEGVEVLRRGCGERWGWGAGGGVEGGEGERGGRAGTGGPGCVTYTPGRPPKALKHREVSSTRTGRCSSLAARRHFSALTHSGSPCGVRGARWCVREG